MAESQNQECNIEDMARVSSGELEGIKLQENSDVGSKSFLYLGRRCEMRLFINSPIIVKWINLLSFLKYCYDIRN